MRSHNTREKIIQSAIRLFGKHGYEAVSLRQIAEDVGIRSGSVYNHFPSKQEMIDAIAEYIKTYLQHYEPSDEEIVERLKSETPGEILTTFISFYEREDNEMFVAVCRLMNNEQYDSRIICDTTWEFFVRRSSETIARVLDIMIEQGAIPPCDSMALGQAWSRAHHIYAVLASHDPGLVDIQEYTDVSRFMIKVAVTGITSIPTERIRLIWEGIRTYSPEELLSQETTRDKILIKSVELFSRYGYNAVSIRQIADHVGIRGASIYNHYAGKNDIMNAIINRYLYSIRQYNARNPAFRAVLQHRDPVQLILSLTSSFPPMQHDLGLAVYRILFREQYQNEELRDFILATLQRDTMEVRKTLDALAKDGRIPPGDSHKLAVVYVFCMCSLALEETLYEKRMPQLQEMRMRIIALTTSIAMYGLSI